MLFRYSALTFNGHRIHYDQPYVTGEEGYPGLVVHGPLQATLLLHLAAGALPGRRLARFEYRALSPAFAGEPLEVHGQPEGDPAGAVGEARLWATTTHGRRTMAGTVAWAAAD
jgi:3-methylfumaryl-CoA hydratase